jgi:hypothetical protein
MDELEAERQKIEAEMSKVQNTLVLSKRRGRVIEIDKELRRLGDK